MVSMATSSVISLRKTGHFKSPLEVGQGMISAMKSELRQNYISSFNVVTNW